MYCYKQDMLTHYHQPITWSQDAFRCRRMSLNVLVCPAELHLAVQFTGVGLQGHYPELKAGWPPPLSLTDPKNVIDLSLLGHL